MQWRFLIPDVLFLFVAEAGDVVINGGNAEGGVWGGVKRRNFFFEHAADDGQWS